jgi:transcriptional regulator of heat shock response
MQHFSLVTSTYVDGGCTGSIGIIGPRRMRYSRAIAAVDRVSRAVSRVLVAQAASSDHDRRRDSRIA